MSQKRKSDWDPLAGAVLTDQIAAYDQLRASANRDEAVFGDPDEFRLDRDPSDNLLYGAGIHHCPGAPLARLELRLVMEELLARTQTFCLTERLPARAAYPASGFTSLHLSMVWKAS